MGQLLRVEIIAMDNVMFLTGQILKRQNKYIFPPIVNSCMIEIIFGVKHIFKVLFQQQNNQNEGRCQPNCSPPFPYTSNIKCPSMACSISCCWMPM